MVYSWIFKQYVELSSRCSSWQRYNIITWMLLLVLWARPSSATPLKPKSKDRKWRSPGQFQHLPAGRPELITSFTSLKWKESDSFVGLGYEVPQAYILRTSLGFEEVWSEALIHSWHENTVSFIRQLSIMGDSRVVIVEGVHGLVGHLQE